MNLSSSHWLMLAGIVLAAIGYFTFTWRRHNAGLRMIAEKDKRLFPPDYENLSQAQRRELYRTHTMATARDQTGRMLIAAGVAGVLLFVSGMAGQFAGIE